MPLSVSAMRASRAQKMLNACCMNNIMLSTQARRSATRSRPGAKLPRTRR